MEKIQAFPFPILSQLDRFFAPILLFITVCFLKLPKFFNLHALLLFMDKM